MDSTPSRGSTMDPLSRSMIFTSALVSIVALTLTIVGTATYSWYYNQDSNGIILSYNLFTLCTGSILNGSSNCIDMPRGTLLGLGTQQAAGLLIVGICLLGISMLIVLGMNVILLTGTLALIAPTVHFLAALFIMAGLAQGSRVTIYNSYSSYLVETGYLLTILSMGLIGFASGRLHFRFYEEF